MIEPLMYAGLGMLAASLIWLLAMPLIWNRAVRLTMRRIEGLVPVSMAEIQADKDQLRAEFAMSTRRLEMGIDQLREKAAGHMGELSRRAEVIARQKQEITEKSAIVAELDARSLALQETLRTTQQEFDARSQASILVTERLAEAERHLEELRLDLGQTASLADDRQREIAALTSQVASLKAEAANLQAQAATTRQRLATEHLEAKAIAGALAEERDHARELEQQLESRTSQAEIIAHGVDEMKDAFERQSGLLALRDEEISKLAKALTAAREAQAASRAEADAALSSVDRRIADQVAQTRLLEGALANAREEREKLQHELVALRHHAGKNWQNERVEDALLRERINDLAAQIAHMTATIEGTTSPIHTILETVPADGEGGTLAERIKALQLRASRLGAAN